MPIIYLDTSALLKRYVQEAGSDVLSASWSTFQITGSAIVIYTEMAAALSKAVRQQWQTETDAQAAWQMFLSDWSQLTLLGVDFPVIQRSGDLAWVYGYGVMTRSIWQRHLPGRMEWVKI